MQELYTRLFKVIVKDLKSAILLLVQCLKTKPIITLSVGTLVILVGLLLGIIFTTLSNLIIVVLIIIYFINKIKFIYKNYKKIEEEKIVNLERERLQNKDLSLQSKQQELEVEKKSLEARQQELEVEKQYIETRQQEFEIERQELEVRQQELETGIEASEQELTELDRVYEQILETRQNEFDKLKDQERESKKALLRDLEEKVKEWLDQDRTTLLERAGDTLRIQLGEDSWELNAIETSKPIQKLFGVSSSDLKRRLKRIETDRDNSLLAQNKHFDGLLIDKQDFRREKSLDRKIRFGVYEFNAIFFCANFLAYYKCYWNFIKHLRVDEEICEILYDSIVSVKLKTRSSARLKDQTAEREYRDFLSMTTKDGKIISFRIDEDRIERIGTEGSMSESQTEEAGRILRQILRQRRIDI